MDNLATAISQYEERPHSRMRENRNLDCEESTYSLRKNPSLFTETTADTTSKNLGRFAASSSYSSESRKNPPQIRYTIISRLADRAVKFMKDDPRITPGDLAENLKTWAAQERIPYFDAWPGVASPIQQAITIAIERCA
jgi:hypothetical protein